MSAEATMRAARWHARRDIRIDTVPVPEPLPHQALIRVLWCGICGTDLEEYRDGPVTVPVGEPHPVSGRTAPMTLGHEVVGVVERAAADGSGPPAGTVVVPDVVVGCGNCWWCARHEDGLCASLSVLGQYDDGGLAEFMVAKAASCLVVPGGMPPELAALAEPASVAVRALRKLGPVLGLTVAVVGGGTIGLLIAQLARASGVARVIVVDPVPERRRLAVELAGALACAPGELDELAEALGEPGIDAVFECTGRQGVLADSVRRVRRGGTVVAVGLRDGDEAIPLADLVLGEKRVLGTAAHVWDTDVADALALLADGRLAAGPLITHRVELADLVDGGLGALADPGAGALKVLVRCGELPPLV